ncbi:CHAT domain-containing protein [Pseudonocardia lacus]|uniref:CHAT domain-containing protein n=1 Tax=Pseudonocardia lacus TaxID=2835865 RepID=UPI001BDCA325|nr:CHAT domain-containing protein [Pseudonocardia lacus]
MSILLTLRIGRRLTRALAEAPDDRLRLDDKLYGLVVRARTEAARERELGMYSFFSRLLGDHHAATEDPSDALRPYGCAYLAACAGGEETLDRRRRAAEGLAEVYASLGQHFLAAECLEDVLMTSASATDPAVVEDLLRHLVLVDPEPAVLEEVMPVYGRLRRELPRRSAAASAVLEVVDARYGTTRRRYRELNRTMEPVLGSIGGELCAAVHLALAEAAAREGLLRAAAGHLDRAWGAAAERAHHPWLDAPVHGLAAHVALAGGRVEEALDLALRGWASVVPAVFRCKDDFSRRFLQGLARRCVEVAVRCAHRLGDRPLLVELIENSRLQLAPQDQVRDDAEDATTEAPDWIVEATMYAHGNGAARAGHQALFCGDWKTAPTRPTIVTCGGSRRLAAAVARSDRAGPGGTPVETDAFADLADRLRAGAVVWSATVQSGTLFWALTDCRGTFDGGSVDLDRTPLGDCLDALRTSLLTERAHDPTSDAPAAPLARTDVLSAMTDEGCDREAEITRQLAALVPHPLAQAAAGRPPGDPLPVLFGVPPELAVVPWAVLPINHPDAATVRLVERVELTLLTPTAVRASVPRAGDRDAGGRAVRLSVCNPAGDLREAPPVPADVVLDGGPPSGTPVSLARFVEEIDSTRWPPDAVLFVRSHLGSSSNAGFVADSGIAFADEVLSARLIATRMPDGEPLVPVPRRVVLALCSGSGAADATGLTLGIASACRLAGAQEVLTSNYNVFDTTWCSGFDHRLANAATRPGPAAAALRDLQLDCLDEWRSAPQRARRSIRNSPTPLVWAAYGVVV